MTNYRRSRIAGASYFFTVNLADRSQALLTEHITLLRSAFEYTRERHSFIVDAMVVLPEHLIRDEEDFSRHVDYIHINPLKHGLVKRVTDWPHSSFHRYVRAGILPMDWAGGEGVELEYGERESD